jgi:RNA polymerase sigma factor (sigma-70 family)
MTESPRDLEAGIAHLIPHGERGTDAQAVLDSLRDPALFASVFERHFASVHRYARQRVGADSADEIAAETFLVAFDSRRRFDGRRASARPWLLGIATNLIRRRWRDEQRQLAAYAKVVSEAPTSAANDGAVAMTPALDDDLAAALAGLTRDDRDTLFLYVWADLSYEEIGEALGVPIGTVRSRIARARRLLRGHLAPVGDCACAAPRNPYVQTALAEEPDHG